MPRIATWAKFRHTESARTVFHFNTHFALTEHARRQGAVLLLARIKEKAGSLPASP